MEREEFNEEIRVMWKDLREKGLNDEEIGEVTERLFKKIRLKYEK